MYQVIKSTANKLSHRFY